MSRQRKHNRRARTPVETFLYQHPETIATFFEEDRLLLMHPLREDGSVNKQVLEFRDARDQEHLRHSNKFKPFAREDAVMFHFECPHCQHDNPYIKPIVFLWLAAESMGVRQIIRCTHCPERTIIAETQKADNGEPIVLIWRKQP
jgi:hypothetical protein